MYSFLLLSPQSYDKVFELQNLILIFACQMCKLCRFEVRMGESPYPKCLFSLPPRGSCLLPWTTEIPSITTQITKDLK